jgi:hypothetical protein
MTVTGQEITDYVERVRAALADLPPTVRDELTEDLPEHLAEVAAEAEGSLVDRLGTPEAYAIELRAAAGVGGPGAGRRGSRRRLVAAGHQVRARWSELDVRLGPLLGYATASEFLRLLRPAWWVLRGYLAAALLSAVLGGNLRLLPRPFGSESFGLLLLAVAVLASISLGRRGDRLPAGPRWLLHLGTLVLVVFGLVLVVNLDEQRDDFGYREVSVGNPYDEIQDVFVYDGEGRLVPNARLFDQNGTPIRLGYPSCPDPLQPDQDDPMRRGYPYCPELAPFQPRSPANAPAPPAAPTLNPTGTPSPTGTPTPAAPTSPATTPATPTPAPTVTG